MKPTKAQYFAISFGIICSNCLKKLRYNNHKSCLCIDCYLNFIAEEVNDIQCESLNQFDTIEET